jgi:hypothetical protein
LAIRFISFGETIGMKASLATTCLLVLATHNSPTRLAADEPKGVTENKMLGTWKLVSAKYGGEESTLPKEATTLKHVTPTHYTWATYGTDGKVSRTQGGPYTFDGELLKSTPEYGLGPGFEAIKGKPQSFECKFEGNKFYQSGTLSTGLALEEFWEKVEKK